MDYSPSPSWPKISFFSVSYHLEPDPDEFDPERYWNPGPHPACAAILNAAGTFVSSLWQTESLRESLESADLIVGHDPALSLKRSKMSATVPSYKLISLCDIVQDLVGRWISLSALEEAVLGTESIDECVPCRFRRCADKMSVYQLQCKTEVAVIETLYDRIRKDRGLTMNGIYHPLLPRHIAALPASPSDILNLSD